MRRHHAAAGGGGERRVEAVAGRLARLPVGERRQGGQVDVAPRALGGDLHRPRPRVARGGVGDLRQGGQFDPPAPGGLQEHPRVVVRAPGERDQVGQADHAAGPFRPPGAVLAVAAGIVRVIQHAGQFDPAAVKRRQVAARNLRCAGRQQHRSRPGRRQRGAAGHRQRAVQPGIAVHRQRTAGDVDRLGRRQRIHRLRAAGNGDRQVGPGHVDDRRVHWLRGPGPNSIWSGPTSCRCRRSRRWLRRPRPGPTGEAAETDRPVSAAPASPASRCRAVSVCDRRCARQRCRLWLGALRTPPLGRPGPAGCPQAG